MSDEHDGKSGMENAETGNEWDGRQRLQSLKQNDQRTAHEKIGQRQRHTSRVETRYGNDDGMILGYLQKSCHATTFAHDTTLYVAGPRISGAGSPDMALQPPLARNALKQMDAAGDSTCTYMSFQALAFSFSSAIASPWPCFLPVYTHEIRVAINLFLEKPKYVKSELEERVLVGWRSSRLHD